MPRGVSPVALRARSDSVRNHGTTLQALGITISGMGDSLPSRWLGEPLDPAALRANVVRSRAVQPIEVKERHAGSVELPTPLIESVILTMRAP